MEGKNWQLIQRKPITRLGLNGPKEVKTHAWMKDFPWQTLVDKQIVASFIPPDKVDNFDSRNINENWKDNQDVIRENSILLKQNSVQSLFNGYYYDIHVASKIEKPQPKDLQAQMMVGSSQTTNASSSNNGSQQVKG